MAISDIVVLIVGLIVVILCVGFALYAWYQVSNYITINKLETSTTSSALDIQSAKQYLLWGSLLTGLAGLIVIGMLVMAFMYRTKPATRTIQYTMIGLGVLTWLLVLIGGILIAVGANKLRDKSTLTVKKNIDGYNWAVASAVGLLLVANILFLVYVGYLIFRLSRARLSQAYDVTKERAIQARKYLGEKLVGSEEETPVSPRRRGQLTEALAKK